MPNCFGFTIAFGVFVLQKRPVEKPERVFAAERLRNWRHTKHGIDFLELAISDYLFSSICSISEILGGRKHRKVVGQTDKNCVSRSIRDCIYL